MPLGLVPLVRVRDHDNPPHTPRMLCPVCHVCACRGNQESTSTLLLDTETSESARVYVSEEAVEPGGGVKRAREMEAQMDADQVSAWPTVLTRQPLRASAACRGGPANPNEGPIAFRSQKSTGHSSDKSPGYRKLVRRNRHFTT